MLPDRHEPFKAPLITPFTLILFTVSVIGLYFLVERFVYGLGAVTNLNQGYPWGIWVIADIKIATALGSGGFAVAALIYIFNRYEYHALMRPALLAAVLGYTLGSAAAFIDLGRYWNFYHIVLPDHAQPNSIMFEVALCMLAYTAVLWIEFAPVIADRFGWTKLKRVLRPIMVFFIALGILLPVMHQSSFGSVLLVMGSKLSPLWYSQWLPLYYLITAIAMGFAAVMVEATVASHRFRVPSEQHLLARLAKIVAVLIGLFLLMRLGELWLNDALWHVVAGDRHALMFQIELALFAIGFLVFASPGGRASERWSFIGASALVFATALYRLNAAIIGIEPLDNWSYFPSVPELMVTVGFVALEILLYLILVKLFPVLHTADVPTDNSVKA